MPEWMACRLGDLIGVKHGYAFKGEFFSEDGPGPLLLTPGNFAIGGGFKAGKPKYYLGPTPDEFRLEGGELVVTMTDLSKAGDTLGYPAIIPAGPAYLHNQRIGLVTIKDHSKLDKLFLFYALRTSDYRGHILAGASGSTVRHTSPGRISDYVFSIPGLGEQRAISAVLGALDDKIAVNDRIVRTSLDLADTFYEAYSGNLNFGPETFGAIASVYGGGTPSTAESGYWDGGIAWAIPSDVTALRAPYLFRTGRTITESGLMNCASQLYPAGSIFMTSRATIGAFAIPQIPAAVNQGFIVVVPPRDELRWWLFHEMRSRIDDMLSLANGSTFLELSRKNFKAIPARVGPSDVIRRFDAKVVPLHQRAAKATQESATLVELRKALLPKLMSGEIRVRDAEKVVEDVT